MTFLRFSTPLVLASLLAVDHARAQDNPETPPAAPPPAPPPAPPSAPPAPPPAAAPAPREAEPPAPGPLDRGTLTASVGSTVLLNAGETPILTAQAEGGKWWKNFFFGFRMGGGALHDTSMGWGALSARVLGSSTDSGPFVGAGLGVMHIDVDSHTGATFRASDRQTGFYTHVEIGAIVRGRFVASVGLMIPHFTLEGTTKTGGTEPGGAHRDQLTRVTALPLTAHVGYMF
jgi:hypothetical protein